MAIRLRVIQGKMTALCAAKAKFKKGDVYLNDTKHHALSEKFYSDFVEMKFIEEKTRKTNQGEA